MQDHIGLSLLLIAVIFLVGVTAPIIPAPGYINGGDNYIHTAEIMYLDRLLTEDGTVFGWYHFQNTGHPLFYFYQSLFHIAVVALHKATSMGILAAEKVALCAVISLYPVSLFVFLGRIGYSKIVSGLAALFSVTSNAAWGNGITTYFYSGAITGAMGMLLFPIALALAYDAIARKRLVWALIAALILSMFAHFLISYMLGIVMTLFVLTLAVRGDGMQFRSMAGRYAAIIVASALLASPYIMPMMQEVSGRSVVESLVRNGWYEGWYQNSFTLPETLEHYLGGRIFDGASPELRRYNWYDNSANDRLPLLTALSLIGFAYCALRPGEKHNGFLSIGLLFSVLIYSGEDDSVFLKLMPFHNHLWYIRTIVVFEFFVVILAAIGLYQVGGIFAGLASRALAKKGSGRRQHTVLLAASVFILSVGVFGHLLPERYAVFTSLVRTVANDELEAVRDVFGRATYERDARMYVGHELNVTMAHERYPVFIMESGLPTIMPPVWEQNYYTQQMLFRMIPQGFENESLAKGIPYKPQVMELFNIRYLLAASGWGDSPDGSRVTGKTALSKNARFEFYEVPGDHSYFQFAARKPVLAFASDDSWFGLGLKWLNAYQTSESYSELPFVVRSKNNVLDDVDLDANAYPALILLDYEARDRNAADAKLRRYVASGGQVISWEAAVGANASPSKSNAAWIDIVLPATAKFSGAQELQGIESGMQRYKLEYRTDEPRFLVFKMSYFSGWKAAIDGAETETVDVTPGFVGLWAPPGGHILELEYSQGDGYTPYLFALCGIALAYYITRKGVMARGLMTDAGHARRPWAYSLLACLLALYMGGMYVLEEHYGMPVLEMPTTGESYSTYRTPLIWEMRDRGPGESPVGYEVQVSECPMRFDECVIFNRTTKNRYYYLDSGKFEPGGLYSWRARAMFRDGAGAWSMPDWFRTHKNAPNIGNIRPTA